MRSAEHDMTGTTAEILLDAGADMTLVEPNGLTAFMGACKLGNESVVRLLMARGASVRDLTEDGWTSLMLAADSGHLKLVQFLVDEGCDIQAKNANGRTALIFAAREGHVEVVRYLLNKGANKDAGPVMETPISVVFHKKGRSGVVRELMRSGASMVVDPGQGITALHVAACMNLLDIARVLLEEGCEETTLTGVTKVPPAAFIGKPVGIAESDRDHAREGCMRRLLARGPAFRAVSWLWPPAMDGLVRGGNHDHRSRDACCVTLREPGSGGRAEDLPRPSPLRVTWLRHRRERRQGMPRPVDLTGIFCRQVRIGQ